MIRSDLLGLAPATAVAAARRACERSGRRLLATGPGGRVLLTDAARPGSVLEVRAGVAREVRVPARSSRCWYLGEAILALHDGTGGDAFQLSLLARDAAEPRLLTRGGATRHFPHLVQGRSIYYSTESRHHRRLDLRRLDLDTGDDDLLLEDCGLVTDVARSSDGRLAVALIDRRPGVSLVVETGTGWREIVDRDRPATHRRMWFGRDGRLRVVTDLMSDRYGIHELDTASGRWRLDPAGVHPDADIDAVPSPDREWTALVGRCAGRARLRIAGSPDTIPWEVPLPVGDVADLSWDPDSRGIALVATGVDRPDDVLRVDLPSRTVRPVVGEPTAPRPGSPPPRRSERPPVIETGVRTRDGLRVPVRIMPPTSAVRPAPVVVHLHGGPEEHVRDRYLPSWAMLRDAGFLVVAPDVRGSSGHGRRWAALDDRELRGDAVDDVSAVVSAVATWGGDPQRCFAWGASYGAYLAAMSLAATPGAWAGAVLLSGMYSLTTFLENTAPSRREAREREFGTLARDRDLLHRLSPLSRADRITAPVLLIHGAADTRVPLSESTRLRDHLDRAGTPVDLLVYEGEGHGFTRVANRVDAYGHALRFLSAPPARRTAPDDEETT